jgi:hypothetical protein
MPATLLIPNTESIHSKHKSFIAESDITEVATERATGQATLKFNNNIFLGFKTTITAVSYT